MGVAKDLDLDVPWPRHITLYQNMLVAEAGLRLALARGQSGGEIIGLVDPAHALAAAAGAGLDQHRVADARGFSRQEIRLVVVTVIARHQRHAGLGHQGLGGRFAAHRGDGCGWRADEGDAGIGTGLGEGLVLAEETVAGVHRLRATSAGCGQDHVGAQIAVARRRAADVHRLIAGQHMLGLGIGIGIHRHGADAHSARGGGDAAGDLATVGDQDFGEHGFSKSLQSLFDSGS